MPEVAAGTPTTGVAPSRFSGAIRTMRRRIVAMPRGRPGPRRPRPSYVLAISCRCQRRRVSGVTRVCRSRRTRREARGLGGPAPARRVGDPEPARTALLSADAMLFLERVNAVTRLLVDPARDGHDEELQHVGKRRHTGRASQRLSAVTNVATRRASSVESARRTASIGFLDSTRMPQDRRPAPRTTRSMRSLPGRDRRSIGRRCTASMAWSRYSKC